MAFVDLDGTLDGVGDLSGTLGVWPFLSGSLDGAGDLESTQGLIVTVLFGGQTYGEGDLSFTWDVFLDGVLDGTGGLSGTLTLIQGFSGSVYGAGDLHDILPLPMVGTGNLVGILEILQTPRPICPPECLAKFGYLQPVGQGLKLCLRDARGNVITPMQISYSFYEVLHGGYKQLRGPGSRVPARDACGCYYATGIAGECGQPGTWVIHWSWQVAPGLPYECFEQSFLVQDAASANPCDPNRIKKYGWNC